jgi:hypothetical protein
VDIHRRRQLRVEVTGVSTQVANSLARLMRKQASKQANKQASNNMKTININNASSDTQQHVSCH